MREKQTLNFRDIMSGVVADGRIGLPLIGPKAITNLDAVICPERTHALPLQLWESDMDLAFIFSQCFGQVWGSGRKGTPASSVMLLLGRVEPSRR